MTPRKRAWKRDLDWKGSVGNMSIQESKAEKAMDALLSVSAMDTGQACREDRDALRHGDH